MTAVLGSLLLLTAGVFFLLAWLIGVRRRLHLLAGYSAARVTDPDGLARLAGRTLLAIGVVTLLVAFAAAAFADVAVFILCAYVAFVVAATLYLVATGQRYTRQPG